MNNLFRGLIAAYGAKKLGGGCLSTIVIFVLIYVALGQCGNTASAAAARQARVTEARALAGECNVQNSGVVSSNPLGCAARP